MAIVLSQKILRTAGFKPMYTWDIFSREHSEIVKKIKLEIYKNLVTIEDEEQMISKAITKIMKEYKIDVMVYAAKVAEEKRQATNTAKNNKRKYEETDWTEETFDGDTEDNDEDEKRCLKCCQSRFENEQLKGEIEKLKFDIKMRDETIERKNMEIYRLKEDIEKMKIA